MKINAENVMKIAGEFVKNGHLTYSEFDILFDFLNEAEQFEAECLLNLNGVTLTDGFASGSDTPFISADNGAPVVMRAFVSESNEELCNLIASGSRQALEDIVVKNKGLVLRYAKIYRGYSHNDLEMDDLIDAGNRGILEAVKRYNPETGTLFSTYATYWITQSIRREAQNAGHSIHIPCYMHDAIARLNRAAAYAEARGITGCDSVAAIAEMMGLSEERACAIISVRDHFLSTSSLDSAIGEDTDCTLGNFISDGDDPVYDEICQRDTRNSIRNAIGRLQPREAYVIRRRFGIGYNETATLETVGSELKLTRERVRQIEDKALRKLRRFIRSVAA